MTASQELYAEHSDAIPRDVAAPRARLGWPRLAALALLILAGDLLLYQVLPGIGLALFCITVAAATHLFCFRDTPLGSALLAWGFLLFSLLPSVELVQGISVMLALLGMAGFAGLLAGGHSQRAPWAALRFPLSGAIMTGADAVHFARTPRRQTGSIIGSLKDWIIPLTLSLVFGALLILANPVLDLWVSKALSESTLPLPDAGQLVFWIVLAPVIWPFLRLSAIKPTLLRNAPQVAAFGQVWYLTERSVLRALVLFNLIFAVQTASDLTILWGGATLPDGLTYAQYAHRGAYQLLAAALLAGGFALLAQPFLVNRPVLRVLLMVWVGQTALLVISAMMRLDLYIDSYGLTHMRFLAFVGMGLIAGGLALMLWQMLRGFGPGWLMSRAAELAFIATFVVALVNIDGLIARHNLNTAELELDEYYICELGAGAAPAIAAYNAEHRRRICGQTYYHGPKVATPADWREWGYRNARLRRKLTEIEGLHS
ncbi:protein of unknown function [Cognatiyoonia koreensis]|uniref:Uncharacterized protein n=1 Tax=Cognatiyoonia koreensis TaxID=364200 RepID=A0A1I0QQ26_9RHOB|nr:DUF4173 domain-containing protein [Cognatiyoonia koreensis]SEW29543.1 protein of unknown function [Cognatiyoonia koreensis]